MVEKQVLCNRPLRLRGLAVAYNVTYLDTIGIMPPRMERNLGSTTSGGPCNVSLVDNKSG